MRWLAGGGAALIALGLGIWAVRRLRLLPAHDKDAFYLFGHWFDALWEVQIPLMLAGLLLLGVASFRRKRKTGGE